MDIAEPVNRLIEQFKKLPGIGTKSAQRLAFFVLKMETASATELAETILEVKRTIRRCSICNNLTDVDPCQFCTAPSRSDKAAVRGRGIEQHSPRGKDSHLQWPLSRADGVALADEGQ